jgi:predicted deacylase
MSRRVVPPAPPGAQSLRRDPALMALSRDHHAALVQALELRRAREASGSSALRRARAYLAFVDAELRGHFADEEAAVLPAAEAVAPAEVERVRAEHREIERLTAELGDRVAAGDVPPALCGELGDLLHDHVRFEERALFESLQRDLDPPALARLGESLRAHRAQRGRGDGCALTPK